MQHIKAWFHNHTRGSTLGTGTWGVLKMTGQPRVQQEQQVYQSMTYEKKWKPIIDEEWNVYKKQWKAENPNTSIPKNHFMFMNNFIMAKYAKETDKVKDKVKECHKAIKAKVDGVAGEQNNAYQRKLNFSLLLGNITHVRLSAINKLPHTLKICSLRFFITKV